MEKLSTQAEKSFKRFKEQIEYYGDHEDLSVLDWLEETAQHLRIQDYCIESMKKRLGEFEQPCEEDLSKFFADLVATNDSIKRSLIHLANEVYVMLDQQAGRSAAS